MEVDGALREVHKNTEGLERRKKGGTSAQPVHHQPPLHDPELPGAGVPPGLQPRCEPEDGPTWAWPDLDQRPGGLLQWGIA
eukprot:11677820-Prorocentrum_lima.AAC.1